MVLPIQQALSSIESLKADSLAEGTETIRLSVNNELDGERRSAMGQFMTPLATAKLMASMFDDLTGDIHLLDAGAGVGSLTAAFVEEACNRQTKPDAITANTYELEPVMVDALEVTTRLCRETCEQVGIGFKATLFEEDFIQHATSILMGDLFKKRSNLRFNRAILNPPYSKINSNSTTRQQLRSVGIETSNLYTAFVALTILLLDDGGELVAITPRSFCNGPYFKPFRDLLLKQMSIKQIHIFESRNKAFKGDSVLQENVIIHAVKAKTNGKILISSNACAEDTHIARRYAKRNEVIIPNDPERFIHIATSDKEGKTAALARSLPCSLEDLNVQVSTGRVVDFRATEHLRMTPDKSTVPLIYPRNFEDGFVTWPKDGGRKPMALFACEETDDLMVPSGIYVLTKRFTSKEERRRVVAAIYDPKRIKARQIGFENHLNYFHTNRNGLAMSFAKGLTLFLNSSLVDNYFRQFNGHTQVNATDLRSLRYPTIEQLNKMGKRVKQHLPDQACIDRIIEAVLFN